MKELENTKILLKELKKPKVLLEKLLKTIVLEEIDDLTKERFHLYLKQLLWNEIEELNGEFINEILHGAVCLYYEGELDQVDIRSFLNRCYFEKLVSDIVYSRIIASVLLKDTKLPKKFVAFIQQSMKDFGVNNLNLNSVVLIAEELGEDISEYDIVLSKFDSFLNRPEYLKDIIDNTDLEELEFLQYWVAPEIKSAIVDTILSRRLENMKLTSFEQTIQNFNSDDYLQDFPVSYAVLGDKIASFEPRSINMDELNDLTPDLSKLWLPSFVYSRPELEENIRIYFPGGPNIGHSAIIVKSNFGSFMMDYGLSVVNTSKSQWMPLIEKLDFILISHAHLDHSGSLPIFYGKERKLPWFGTEQTKIMTEMLWNDTRSILGKTASREVIESQPYLRKLVSKSGIINTVENFHELKLNKSYKLSPSIEVKASDANHLFGSVGYEVTVGGKRILYTGDFNKDKGADFVTDADITLFDSTYFERYDSYPKPEEGLKAALSESNRIIIPAFSMGRSQEMLFKLKELEAEKNWTIYLTGMGGRLASKLNLSVGSNHGREKGGVNIVPTVATEDFVDKTIVIAGQGMIQAGTSRNLFEHSKDDEMTSVVLCGYQAPNTLGFHLLKQDKYLLGKYKQQVRRVKISGHTTGENLDKFMDDISNQKVMVHAPEGAYNRRNRKDVEQPSANTPIQL